MEYSENVLSYILDQLSNNRSQKTGNVSHEPAAFSWAYTVEKKDFDKEHEQFKSAKNEFDFEIELEILSTWRDRYSKEESPTAKKLTQRLNTLIKNVQKKIKNKEEFHQLVAGLHQARKNNDIGKEIQCFTKIYNSMGEHVYSDVYAYKKELTTQTNNPVYRHQYIKGGSPRIHAELSRCIALHLSALYGKNAHIASRYGANPYEWKSRAEDWKETAYQQYKKLSEALGRSFYQDAKDFAPFRQDPFIIGGLYGPETVQQENQNTPLSKEEKTQETNTLENTPSPTPGIHNGMPSVFSQEVLDFMVNKHTRFD